MKYIVGEQDPLKMEIKGNHELIFVDLDDGFYVAIEDGTEGQAMHLSYEYGMKLAVALLRSKACDDFVSKL